MSTVTTLKVADIDRNIVGETISTRIGKATVHGTVESFAFTHVGCTIHLDDGTNLFMRDYDIIDILAA